MPCSKSGKTGTFSTLVDPIRLEGCDVDYPDNTNNPLPYLRELAADNQGTVFAAGTAYHCVVKITPAGKAEPILKPSALGHPPVSRCTMVKFTSSNTLMRMKLLRRAGCRACERSREMAPLRPY